MMRKVSIALACLVVVGFVSATFGASLGGLVASDRFGYNGTIDRYASLQDAQNATNSTDTITVNDRDLSLYIAKDVPGWSSDYNIMMGSWWYTTDSEGRDGYDNTRGNTGVGFMQLYDDGGATDTNLAMGFGGFDGTYYTEYNLLLEGENAGADEAARLSAYDNVNDGGIWHEYALDLTAGGLEGQFNGSNMITSNNQPTSVTGSISGIFQITENNETYSNNQGFYTVDFDLTMINWAWENRNDLMTQDETGAPASDTFDESQFVEVVPEPLTMLAVGSAVAGLGGYIRRRRRG